MAGISPHWQQKPEPRMSPALAGSSCSSTNNPSPNASTYISLVRQLRYTQDPSPPKHISHSLRNAIISLSHYLESASLTNRTHTRLLLLKATLAVLALIAFFLALLSYLIVPTFCLELHNQAT